MRDFESIRAAAIDAVEPDDETLDQEPQTTPSASYSAGMAGVRALGAWEATKAVLCAFFALFLALTAVPPAVGLAMPGWVVVFGIAMAASAYVSARAAIRAGALFRYPR